MNSGDEKLNFSAFEDEEVYPMATVSKKLDAIDDTYSFQLLRDKIDIVNGLGPVNYLVDLGCGTATTLGVTALQAKAAMGIDLTYRYLIYARENDIIQNSNVSLVQADVTRLPIRSGSVDLVYSFSTLPIVTNLSECINEVGRILAPEGRCVLDLGNKKSLNAYCLSKYPTDWSQLNNFETKHYVGLLAKANLEIETWRSFQLLPLWADKPKWLWPLLHPAWQQILKRRIRGIMLDELISSLPFLRRYAFRHILVCRRNNNSTGL